MPDVWDAGAKDLLRRYCRTSVLVERWHDELDKSVPGSIEANRLHREVVSGNASLSLLASKLRISVQAQIDRRSGRITEVGIGVGRSRLLGGHTVGDDWDDGLLGICRDDKEAQARAFPNNPHNRSKQVRQ
jgi:hypothetical protein